MSSEMNHRQQSVAAPARRITRLWLIPVILIFAAAAIGVWLYTSMRVFDVVPDAVFRSRQLKNDELKTVARRHRIRTLINLRGSHLEEPWMQQQLAVCAELGIRHETVTVRMTEWPARHQVRRLVELLETATPPILIHCLRGVDRSGWASAVAQLTNGVPLEEALIQLSPRYGHVCDRESCPLHLFFTSYQNHLRLRAVPEGADAFRNWVLLDYCPDPYNARLTLLSELPTRAAPRQAVRAAVRVANRGPVAWRMTDLETTGVRLGARVIGPYDSPPADAIDILRTPEGPAVDVARSGLEFGVMSPGAERDFELRFHAPAEPGWYVLQIDMVDELVHWFSDLGYPGILHELLVEDEEASS
jgi:protein tyrosine phosphatase (PTP) superfamily phosphohydrolase (DUF442 family)